VSPTAGTVKHQIDTLWSVKASESGAVIRAQPSVEFLPVELDGRHVGVLAVDSPGVRDEWEMHPEQDELLYLLEGKIDVFLRPDLEGLEEETRHFQQGEACLIPKGMWHRQVVVTPCKVLFITPETMHQAYVPESGWVTR
jgi:mannose-6-phosphate isomerase-like protein (cupin superfamily)